MFSWKSSLIFAMIIMVTFAASISEEQPETEGMCIVVINGGVYVE